MAVMWSGVLAADGAPDEAPPPAALLSRRGRDRLEARPGLPSRARVSDRAVIVSLLDNRDHDAKLACATIKGREDSNNSFPGKSSRDMVELSLFFLGHRFEKSVYALVFLLVGVR